MTCFAPDRKQVTIYAQYTVLHRLASQYRPCCKRLFNPLKNMQPCAEQPSPWSSSARRRNSRRRAKHRSMPESRPPAKFPKSTRSVRPYRNIGTSVWNAVSTQLPQGIRPKNTITEQIENLKGQQETLPVDVRYYSFAGAVEGRADGL